MINYLIGVAIPRSSRVRRAVDLGGGDPGQLRNPTTDVITLWIEAF